QRGQMEAAKKAFLEALKHRENDPDTLYAMASVCLSLNDMDEAIKYLTRAEPAAAHLPKIYYALGQAYQRKGNTDKAAQYFNLQKSQESSQTQREKESQQREELTLVTLARERLEQGNAPEALALLQQLLELNPSNWEAHRYLTEIYLSSENWQQA